MSLQNPREIAVEVLGKQGSTDFLEDVLEDLLEKNPLPTKDRGLCQQLVYGVARNHAALDWLINRKTGGREQKPALNNLLRTGLYQIFWTDRIPPHAAVNETVELAKRRGFGQQAGFVNAVLRGYIRETDQTRKMLDALRKSEPWVAYSHPKWLVERWINRWGVEQTTRLLEWNNTPPGVFGRVNTLKTDPGKLLETWREEDVDYDFVRHDWIEENSVFKLRKTPPLHRLPSFTNGLFYVQDPSTLLAVRELQVEPAHNVLDLCAAPGGKLTCIAAAMRGEGHIDAQDITEERLSLVRQNCTRLGVTNVSISKLQEDGAATSYDRVLVDAPCSNTGVMRRRLDLRWRLVAEELSRLVSTQFDLVMGAARRVRPGGLLVYSTCSVEPEENEGLVRQVLERESGFHLLRERTLLPHVEQTDGAYVAVLQKAG